MSAGSDEQKSGDKPLSQRPHVTIYTDGAAEPNPGRGGYGVVLLHPAKRLELSRGFELTTNNRMELLAVIAGLEVLTKPCCVSVHSDSKYVVDAIDKGWVLNWLRKNWQRGKQGPVKNADLWKRYLAAATQHTVKMHWVKGHAGHEHNERCDVLAVAAANGAVLEIDHGYQPDSISVEVTDAIRTATDADTTPSENSSVGQIVPSQQSKVTHKEPGEPCRKCGMPIVKKSPKKQTRKAGQTYYYEWYLHCPNCKTMYMVEAAKRMITSNQKAIFDERGG